MAPLCCFASRWGATTASFPTVGSGLSLESYKNIILFSPVQLCLSCSLFCQYLWSLFISSTEEECFRPHSALLRKKNNGNLKIYEEASLSQSSKDENGVVCLCICSWQQLEPGLTPVICVQEAAHGSSTSCWCCIAPNSRFVCQSSKFSRSLQCTDRYFWLHVEACTVIWAMLMPDSSWMLRMIIRWLQSDDPGHPWGPFMIGTVGSSVSLHGVSIYQLLLHLCCWWIRHFCGPRSQTLHPPGVMWWLQAQPRADLVLSRNASLLSFMDYFLISILFWS